MRKKCMIILTGCLGLFLLTACGSKKYTSVEDFIQVKTDVTANEERNAASGGVSEGVSESQAGGTSDNSSAAETKDKTQEETDDAGIVNVTQDSGAYGFLVDSMPGGKAECWAEAMEHYKEELSGNLSSSLQREILQDTFMTADLNSDGVPELLTRYSCEGYEDGTTWWEYSISTYWTYTVGVRDSDNHSNGKNCREEDCSYSCWYYPGTGVFALGDEDSEVYYYIPDLSGQEEGFAQIPQLLGHVYFDETRANSCDWNSFYFSDSEYVESEDDITAERFYILLKKLIGDTEQVYLPAVSEWYDNTEANRELYLK